MKQRLNLMHIVFSLEIGGLENIVFNLVRKLDKDKYNISICSLSSNGFLKEKLKGIEIPVYHTIKRAGIDFSLFFRLARLFREMKIDLIHTHNSGTWFYGAVAARIAKVKAVVHTEHSNLFPEQRRLMLAERFLSKITDIIIGDSEKVSQYLISREGISSKKIKTIFNGIEIGSSQKEIDIKSKKEKLCIKRDSLIIGNVARLETIKDHFTLLEAFSYILKSIQNVVLVIVGDGSLKKDLVKKSLELGIKNKVYFLGVRDDIPEVMKTFDIYVLSSISEGLPLTLLEAMLAKKPIVATKVGGNPEVVIDGYNGLLVPPKDPHGLANALIKLLTDAETLRKMSDNSYKRVKLYFDINCMKEGYEEVYDICMKNKEQE